MYGGLAPLWEELFSGLHGFAPLGMDFLLKPRVANGGMNLS